MFCFTDLTLSTFFIWWSRVNTVMTRRCVYFTTTFPTTRCQIFILKKTDLIGFFKIKPRHPDRLKKTDLGGRTQQWEPWVWLIILKISPVTSSVPSKERNCARQFAQCYLILAHFQHSKFNTACIYTVSHRPFNAGNPSLVACLHGCGVACV